MTLDKELFLRDKIYCLYTLAVNTIITLSSGAIAFSVGLQIYEKETNFDCLIFIGWASLLFAIFWMIWMMKTGIEFYSSCYKNLRKGEEELSGDAIIFENRLPTQFYFGLFFFFLGIALVLFFIFKNI